MKAIQRISSILKRMSELAGRGNSASVRASLERAAALLERDAQEGANAILGMYGGMGSLSDLVLYEDNKPLVEENKEFDALRTELYDECLELRRQWKLLPSAGSGAEASRTVRARGELLEP